jgi:TolB protein
MRPFSIPENASLILVRVRGIPIIRAMNMLSRLATTAITLSLLSLPLAAQRAITLAYQLTHTDTGEPFPSPDGKKILFESRVADHYQLFTMNPDSTGQMQLTHDPTDHDLPSWSPDGKHIAFVSDRTGHQLIYVMNADGSGEQRPISDPNQDAIHPQWSPDSSKIVYCLDDDLHPPKKNASDIIVVDVTTKQAKVLITGGVNTYPSYSPDGKKIAFRRMIGDMNSEVFVADADGSNQQNISNHIAFDGWPAWSPDSKQIAFASNRRHNYQIFIMGDDGSNVTLLSNTDGRATEPRFAPDAKFIYFTNCRPVDFGADCQVMKASTEPGKVR